MVDVNSFNGEGHDGDGVVGGVGLGGGRGLFGLGLLHSAWCIKEDLPKLIIIEWYSSN